MERKLVLTIALLAALALFVVTTVVTWLLR